MSSNITTVMRVDASDYQQKLQMIKQNTHAAFAKMSRDISQTNNSMAVLTSAWRKMYSLMAVNISFSVFKSIINSL